MRSVPASLAILSTLLFGACGGGGDGTVCTDEAAANFSITVLDSRTDQRICDATVDATDEKTGETQRLTGFGPAERCAYGGGFYERAGTFTVRVSKRGYLGGSKSGVVVGSGVCHIQPVDLTLRISP